jgi:hypothetical protein
MPEYRAYRVGSDGHFTGFEPLLCADDGEAIERAKRLVTKQGIELWCGERLVKRLNVTEKPDVAVSHEIKHGRMVPKK